MYPRSSRTEPQIIAMEKATNFLDHTAWIKKRRRERPNSAVNKLLAGKEGI
jgi:hypothetical protein